MLKKPMHLASVFKDGQPLSEETGEGLARWAQGDAAEVPADEFDGVLTHLSSAPTVEDLKQIAGKWAGKPWTPEQKGELRAVMQARMDELQVPEDFTESEAKWNAPPQGKDCTK